MFGNEQPDDKVQEVIDSMDQETAEEIMGGFDIFIDEFDIEFEDSTLTQKFAFDVDEDVEKDMEEIVEIVKDDIAGQKEAQDTPDDMTLSEDFEVDGNRVHVTLEFDGVDRERAKFVAFQTLIMDQVGEQPQQVAAFVSQVLQPNLGPRVIASLKTENQEEETPDYIG